MALERGAVFPQEVLQHVCGDVLLSFKAAYQVLADHPPGKVFQGELIYTVQPGF